jgi:hypothetical protein
MTIIKDFSPARMSVPKMVENGQNSAFAPERRLQRRYGALEIQNYSRSSKKRTKTILSQFPGKVAR